MDGWIGWKGWMEKMDRMDRRIAHLDLYLYIFTILSHLRLI